MIIYQRVTLLLKNMWILSVNSVVGFMLQINNIPIYISIF